MKWLSDHAVARLKRAVEEPDLTGTRYRLVERLGSGGMGTVYLAEDVSLSRRVALKVLHLPDASGHLAARLLREARVLAQLEHPGIVPVHDVGTLADGRVFYTMKYVEGPRLDRYLQEAGSTQERLRIFEKTCEAVAFAHARGVLHRDLKPENIMVGPFGEVLVMDWGVAKILHAPAGEAETQADTDTGHAGNETEHGMVLGTPGYMAPEQARGELELDARADVYALGAILRYVLTGHAPAEATTLSLAAQGESRSARWEKPGHSLPRALAAVCAKAMAPEANQRYASAEELAQDVARFRDGEPVAAYREGILEKAARVAARHRTAILLVLAYLVMRVALIFWGHR
ncbi:MAG: serine/threonine-protein kinase [Terriglobales bacterium]